MICVKILKLICRLVILSVLLLLVLAFAPGIPPHEDVQPAFNFIGQQLLNPLLNQAKVCVDDGKLNRPESIAVKGSEIYVGESGFGTGEDLGKIVKINEQDWSITTVANLAFPCDKLGRSTCSGVLGVRFDPNGKLVFADMHGGVLRIDVRTGKLETVISINEVIEGEKFGFPEDVAIAKDGTIYVTDGATSFSHNNHYNNAFSHPKGRLLKYDPVSKKTSVLMDKIYFANGVDLSEDETFVLVAESVKYRIIRYYVKGPKKGQKDVFLDGLPGVPDNIRSNGKGGFYISIAMGRPMIEINKYPIVVKLTARITYLLRSVVAKIYSFYPHETTRLTYDVIGMLPFLLTTEDSKLALVLEVDQNGEVIRGMNSTVGNLGSLSQATLSNKHLYFVSPFHDKIWCLEKEKL